MSKLSAMYQRLRADAVQSGSDQRHDLANGARVTVRVQDGIEAVTFARRGAVLGATEEQTFTKHCGIPLNAERIPAVGQATRTDARRWTWHLVTYRWRVEAEQPPLLALDDSPIDTCGSTIDDRKDENHDNDTDHRTDR